MSEFCFLSQTELGKLYGVSSHQIGKWLAAVGLRTADKKPSPRAFSEKFVEQRPSTQPGTYFWTWDREMTMMVITEAGLAMPVNIDTAATTGKEAV